MASLKHLSNRNTTNFARAWRLVSVCGDLLRDVLCHFISVVSLYSELDLAKDKLMKILNSQQRDLLYKKRKSYLLYDDLDISLLYILLRNICDENVHKLSNGRRGMTSPRNGWGKRPPEIDRSLAANIERIHFFRNDICHLKEPSLPDPEFISLWDQISRAIEEIEKDLGNQIHPAKYVELLKTIKTMSMDPEETQKYIEELEKMKDEQKGLEERLYKRITEQVRTDIVDNRKPKIVKSAGSTICEEFIFLKCSCTPININILKENNPLLPRFVCFVSYLFMHKSFVLQRSRKYKHDACRTRVLISCTLHNNGVQT